MRPDFSKTFSVNQTESGLIPPATSTDGSTDGCTDDISARIAALTPNPPTPIDPRKAAFLEAKSYLEDSDLQKALLNTDIGYGFGENLATLLAMRHGLSKPDARRIVESAKSALAEESEVEKGTVL
jgi:hypothetical protein